MTYAIRSAVAADDEEIRAIIRSARLNPLGIDWRRFLVAELDTRILGTIQVKPHGDGTRELASLAVIPGWQGQGVGTALVEAMLAEEDGPLYLTCRSSLEGYYNRFGFRTLARGEMTPYFRRLSSVAQIMIWIMRPFVGDTRLAVMYRERARPGRSSET